MTDKSEEKTRKEEKTEKTRKKNKEERKETRWKRQKQTQTQTQKRKKRRAEPNRKRKRKRDLRLPSIALEVLVLVCAFSESNDKLPGAIVLDRWDCLPSTEGARNLACVDVRVNCGWSLFFVFVFATLQKKATKEKRSAGRGKMKELKVMAREPSAPMSTWKTTVDILLCFALL